MLRLAYCSSAQLCHLVVFTRRAILFQLEGVGTRKIFSCMRILAEQLWSCRRVSLLTVQFKKLAGGLPGALGPAEFAFHFPLISSLAGAKAKWTVLRLQGVYGVKSADSRRNSLPKYLLKHFGNPLCIWLNFSVVSKARHECTCSKSFITSGLRRLREQPASRYLYAVLHLNLDNSNPTFLEQASFWVNCQFCLQLSACDLRSS